MRYSRYIGNILRVQEGATKQKGKQHTKYKHKLKKKKKKSMKALNESSKNYKQNHYPRV